MKIAAAEALAQLAREDVPDEVAAAYAGERLRYGPGLHHPGAVRPAPHLGGAVGSGAGGDGFGGRAQADRRYGGLPARAAGPARPDRGGAGIDLRKVRAHPKRVVFAEGEEEKTIRAALLFAESGFGSPVLIGREERIRETMAAIGLSAPAPLEIHNARLSHRNQRYTEFLYRRLQRQGMLYRDCQRLVNQDRNVFAACMVACGDADAMVTGLTRNSFDVLAGVTPGHRRQAGLADLRSDDPAGARAHRAACRHAGAREPDRGAARRHRRCRRGEGARARARAAGRAAVLFQFRQSARAGRRTRARSRGVARPAQCRVRI